MIDLNICAIEVLTTGESNPHHIILLTSSDKRYYASARAAIAELEELENRLRRSTARPANEYELVTFSNSGSSVSNSHSISQNLSEYLNRAEDLKRKLEGEGGI